MPIRFPFLSAVTFALISCSAVPDTGIAPTAEGRDAEYPVLMPLTSLIALHQTGPFKTVQVGGIGNLEERANDLRGPVIDPQSRAKLLDAIERHRDL